MTLGHLFPKQFSNMSKVSTLHLFRSVLLEYANMQMLVMMVKGPTIYFHRNRRSLEVNIVSSFLSIMDYNKGTFENVYEYCMTSTWMRSVKIILSFFILWLNVLKILQSGIINVRITRNACQKMKRYEGRRHSSSNMTLINMLSR